MALRKRPYLNAGWLSRVDEVDGQLRRLRDELDALCRARPLGRNATWCFELLAAGIAVNEALERLEAMMLSDGWQIGPPPPDPYAEMYGHWLM